MRSFFPEAFGQEKLARQALGVEHLAQIRMSGGRRRLLISSGRLLLTLRPPSTLLLILSCSSRPRHHSMRSVYLRHARPAIKIGLHFPNVDMLTEE
jgi:hypothetical protein